jgi:hypothetical protein
MTKLQKSFSAVVLGAFTVYSVQAQVNIGSESFPNSNSSLGYEIASPAWLAGESLTEISGENQVWNLGDWDSVGLEGETYEPLSEAPGSYQVFFANQFFYPDHFSNLFLPVAQLDLELPFELTDPAIFFRNDETGYYNTGSAFGINGIPVITQNEEVEQLFEYPLVFGDEDTSAVSFLTVVPLFGAYGQSGERVVTVDGLGILSIPQQGEFDVLRIKVERTLVDTFFIEQTQTGSVVPRPLETIYYWVSPDAGAPLLEITQSAGLNTQARLLTDEALSAALLETSDLKIYPNPSRGIIYIEGIDHGSNISYRVSDLSGKRVLSAILDRNSLDLTRLEPGMYLLTLMAEGSTYTERIVITE